MEVAKSAWTEGGQRNELYPSIDSMLERIRRDRGSGSDFFDLKTGIGGIIEAEFLVQAMQMRQNIWEPNWTRAVAVLHESGALSKSETEQLQTAYHFLRRCESVLRRHENRGICALPGDLRDQFRFCRRLGYDKPENFLTEYETARASIHEIYNRRMKVLSATMG